MTRSTGAAARHEAAAPGPFFAFDLHPATAAPAPPWRPVRELVTEPAVLRERVSAVRAHLAAAGGRPTEAVELRVAASVTHLGLAARLMSPLFALVTVHGALPAPVLDGLYWQPALGGPFPLSLPDDRLHTDPSPVSGAVHRTGWAASLVEQVLTELVEAVEALSVSRHVLWGNTASAVNGAATAIARAVPDRAAGARELAALLLNHPRLRDSATPARGTTPFRRRNCCLIYRAAPGPATAVCGDCVLTPRR